jgi:hypothetical protein
MPCKLLVTQSLLWAAAIAASIILHAPAALSGILLPVLATTSLILADARPKADRFGRA